MIAGEAVGDSEILELLLQAFGIITSLVLLGDLVKCVSLLDVDCLWNDEVRLPVV